MNSQYNKENGMLTNDDLEKMCKILKIKLLFCNYKDLLPKKCINGCYIINLSSSNQGIGTHWVSLYVKDKKCLYFDSFGVIYPEEIKEFTKGKLLLYNNVDVQSLDDSHCGYYCLAFLYYLSNHKGELQDLLMSFLSKFRRGDTNQNSTLLKQYIKQIFKLK